MAKINEQELKIPTHLAIILDGNGRWAQKRGLVRMMGHKAGAKALKNIVNYAFSLGIKVLSVYCFSTENWKRDKEEVDYLFTLPVEYFSKYQERLIANGTRVMFSGDISKLPTKTMLSCDSIALNTKECKSNILNICLNYGANDELVRATKLIASKVLNNEMSIEDIDESTIEKHLYTKDLPPVDLLIRTSNEKRISNFLLWQISYAELYFTKTHWPAFTKKELDKAILDYSKRDRRFGGVKK